MDKYCYNGLLWLAQGEDVNIYDAESGDLLVEDFTLTERKDTIELPLRFKYSDGTFTVTNTSTWVEVNCGFVPSKFAIIMSYPGVVSQHNLTPPRIGSSLNNGLINEDTYYPNVLELTSNGFKFKPATSAQSNREWFYSAYAGNDLRFTSPAVGENLRIDLGFKAKAIFLRPTASNVLRHYYYNERFTDNKRYYVGEGSVSVGSTNFPISSVDSNGFVVTPKTANQANVEFDYFAIPDS